MNKALSETHLNRSEFWTAIEAAADMTVVGFQILEARSQILIRKTR